MMHLAGDPDYLLPFPSLSSLTKSQIQMQWCDLLIHLRWAGAIFLFFSAVRLKPKLSFDFLRKPNFTLKKDKLREGRVLSYWFLHIFLRGMFCSCTDENIMVSPWCIWLDYLRYPGRCLLNMLAVQREESKWTCSDWDWFGSLRHWSARSRPVFSCLPNYPKKNPSKLRARLSVCATNASSMVTCHGIGIIVTVGYIMYWWSISCTKYICKDY